MDVLFCFCVQPKHFFVDWNGSDDGASCHVFQRNCVSSEIYVHLLYPGRAFALYRTEFV
jgi:hypothetical protein